MRFSARLPALLPTLLLASPASAIVLFNLDNSATQSDPGGGTPWNSVGRVRTAAGTSTGGSAVYLGNGYVLTANHVSTSSGGFNTIEFGPGLVYPIDFGFSPTQVAAGVDLKVIRLMDHNPVGVDVAILKTSADELIAPSTLIGWGRGRDALSPLGSTTVNWGSDATIAKRWGENVPLGTYLLEYTVGVSYSYESIFTIAGAGSGSPSGLGDTEAAATRYDSGSGLFQFSGGQWHLIGITTAVETDGVTTFGNDQGANPRGNLNFFVRVSSYDAQILAIIPEPSAWAACAGLAGLALAFRRRR